MGKILLLAGVIAIASVALLLCRLQPRGTATVFRSGERIIVRTAPLYARVIGARVCRVRTIHEHLAFDAEAPAASRAGDAFTTHVRFTYLPPALLGRGWAAGDWCSLLETRVAADVTRQTIRYSASDFLEHQRQTTDAISTALDRQLRADGVIPEGVSVRLDLPAGFDRLRAIANVAKQSHAMPPVIFIGLDGADWNLLDGYMGAGLMPNLKKLTTTGHRGTLQTEMPPLSPIVWTTMMTGVGPLQHQILDFARFNPMTHEKEPITSDERRAPAIWNMLTYAGKQAAVFGLWGTYAAEPVHAINVSDRLFTFLYSDVERPRGVVYPPQRQRWAEERVAAAERSVDLGRMREYLPALTDGEFAALSKTQNPYAEPAAALRRILVETEIYRGLSVDYLGGRTTLPDLTVVYFQGTDTIGHEFAPFAPPRQPQVSASDFERYNKVPEKYFRYIDTILGDYIALAERSHAGIVIASDHGFRWSEGRPTEISSTATATAAKWHRNEGIFVVWGANVREQPKGIREICRVLRELTGTPDMDYSQYFERALSPPAPTNTAGSAEDLAKLRALGYIGSNEPARSAVTQSDTKTAGAWNNTGLILRNEHQAEKAIAAFEQALAIDPHYASAMWNLSETLLDARRDLDRSDALLIEALQNGLADAPRFVIVRSIAYDRTSQSARNLRLLEQAVSSSPNNAELRMFRGRYRMEHRDCNGALEDFVTAEQQQQDNALAFASAGLAQMCIGDPAAASESFARARQLDPTLQLPR